LTTDDLLDPRTTVAMVANFAHVGDGNGGCGTNAHTRNWTSCIAAVRARADVRN